MTLKWWKKEFVLEALEFINPLPCPYGFGEPRRIIPAGWWCCDDDLQWVEVATLRIWQIWRLFRISSPHYWPLRIRLGERILWVSEAALQHESRKRICHDPA